MRKAGPTLRLWPPVGERNPIAPSVLVEAGGRACEIWYERGYRPEGDPRESRAVSGSPGPVPAPENAEDPVDSATKSLDEMDIDDLRAEYDIVTGAPPNTKWNKHTLKAKIEAALVAAAE